MQNLISFISRYNTLLLFLVLQLLVFNLISSHRVFQNAALFQMSAKLNGWIYNSTAEVNQYFKLKQLNDSLVNENARLKRNIEQYIPGKIFSDTLEKDTTGYYKLLRLIPSKVIQNSVEIGQNNYLTLDKGRLQGIQEDMAVLSESGIVGVINGVTNNYASVVPLYHQGFRTSGRIKRNNDIGKVYWDGNSPELLTMSDIGDYSDVQVGDTITTTSFSSIFPEGIPIGIVDEVGRQAGSNYYILKIKPITNFRNLYYVYVVEDVLKNERIQLEEVYQNNE